MASLPCKLTAQIAFKAGGDVFHHLFANKPQHLTKVTPGLVKGCDLHHGDFGTIGCIIQWKYTLDGEEQNLKYIIQDIDKEKKLIAYKIVEGDLMQLYKNMVMTVHIETKGGTDFVTWTIDYELLSPDNPHPISPLNFCIEFTNQVEAHIFGP